MTDITDKDKREARKWAEQTIANRVNSPTDPWVIAARLFLANEEPPAPTLAEELRSWAEYASYDEDRDNLLRAAARAEKIEQDLYEYRMLAKDEADLYAEVREERDAARTEVDRLTAERDDLDNGLAAVIEQRNAEETAKREAIQQRDEARAEVDRLTRELDEAHASANFARETVEMISRWVSRRDADRGEDRRDDSRAEVDWLAGVKEAVRYCLSVVSPDPADVPPNEPWLIRVGDREAVANRDGTSEVWPWSVAFFDGEADAEGDQAITLVSRLVPAPRVITDPDELDKLGDETVLRGENGFIYQRDNDHWITPGSLRYLDTEFVAARLPVTVLWEAGE